VNARKWKKTRESMRARPFCAALSVCLLATLPVLAAPAPAKAGEKAPPGAKPKPAESKGEKPATKDAKAGAEAKPSDLEAAAKSEAAQRFDRGLQLFDEGDNAGALAEFKRTYEVMPNPVVLYNMGLVYAAMGRPVDAVDALTTVINAPSLSPAQHERAQKTLGEQQARIGRLSITTTPDAARVEVDNVEVARTPLTAPIRVSEGSHIIGVVADGFAYSRKEVVVAGNADATLHFDLVSNEGKRQANLTVSTHIHGADVFVDNEKLGQTPLASSLSIVPGHHTVEVRRPGYVTAKQDIDLTPGATAEMSLDPGVDAQALGSEGATLSIETKGHASTLFVDGALQGAYTAPVRLPRGPHHVRLEVAGFQPFESDLTLDSAKTNQLNPALVPTPETLAAHDSNIRAHHTWGMIGMIGGAAIAGGGVAFLAVNSSSKSKAQKDYNAAVDQEMRGVSPHCNVTGDVNNGGNSAQECNDFVASQQSNLDSAKSRDAIGYIGLGAGAALLITGVIVSFTGESPNEYKSGASGSETGFGRRLSWAPGPGQVGTGLRLAF